MTVGGLPHSETCGSSCACHYPQLIAAYRVLLRLVMPRHPSCARIRLAEDRNLRLLVYVAILFSQTMQLSKINPSGEGKFRLRRVSCSRLVGVPGIEPGTSSLSGTRSNQLSYTPAFCRARLPSPGDGGGSRVRTGDIQLAKLALYQLSYAPGGRLSRRALKRKFGPLNAVRKGCGRHILVLAGLMWKASPLFPPTRGVSPSPAPCGAASP